MTVIHFPNGGKTRIWIGNVEVTKYVRLGLDPLEVRDDAVVFADTGAHWRPMAPLGSGITIEQEVAA